MGIGDTDENILYDGSQWRLPPWMGGGTVPRDAGRNLQQFAGAELMLSFSVPSLDRHSTPDLDAEGLNADQLASMLHQSQGLAEIRTSPTLALPPLVNQRTPRRKQCRVTIRTQTTLTHRTPLSRVDTYNWS